MRPSYHTDKKMQEKNHDPYDFFGAVGALYGDDTSIIRGHPDIPPLGREDLGGGGSAPYTVWAGGIYDPVGKTPKIGVYFCPGLIGADLLRAVIDPLDYPATRRWGKNLGRGAITTHRVIFGESDHGTVEEQIARIYEIEQATGLQFSVLVYSGSTDPSHIRLAGVDPSWVQPGKSLHTYISLQDDQMVGTSKTDEARWLEAMRLLCVAMGGDPAIVDVARRMRVPGVVAGAPGMPRAHGVRLQALARAPAHARYYIEEVITGLKTYLQSQGIYDPTEAYHSLQIAEIIGKTDPEVAARIRVTRHITPEQQAIVTAITGRGAALRRDVINPATMIRTASGESVRLDRLAADLEPGGATISVYCPMHANIQSPAATVGRDPDGVPSIHCFSACGCHYRAEEPLVFGFGATGATPRETGDDAVRVAPTSLRRREKIGATQTEDINIPGLKVEHHRIHVRYLSEWLPDHLDELLQPGEVLAVRSPWDTGKTSSIKCYLDTAGAAVAVAHRVAIIRSMAGTWGLETYDVDAGAARVATTVDSLWRVPLFSFLSDWTPTERQIDVLFVDEAAQALRHLVGETVGAMSPKVLSHLRALLEQAKHTILADADLDEDTLKTLALLAPGKVVHLVENTYRDTTRNAKMHPDREGLEADAIEAYRSGKTVGYATLGSPDHAAAIARQLRKADPSREVRIYSQDTSRLAEVQKELVDVNTAVTKYGAVVWTPTVGSGVDIALRDHFDLVYLDAPSHDVTAAEALQQALRVRNPSDRQLRIWADPRKRNRPTDPEVIRRRALSCAGKTREAFGKEVPEYPLAVLSSTQPGHYDPLDPVHLDIWCRALADRHRQTNDLRKAVLARLEEAGIAVEWAQPTDAAVKKSTRADRSEARREAEVDRAERIAAAEEMTVEDARKVERARVATQEEQDAAERAVLQHFYGKKPDADLVIKDRRGRLRPKVIAFSAFLLAWVDDKRTALMADLPGLDSRLHAGVRGHYIRAKLIERVLRLYGIKGTPLVPGCEFYATIEPPPDLPAKIKLLAPLLEQYLGVRLRPKLYRGAQVAPLDFIGLLSSILGRVGVKLDREEKKVDGHKARRYRISEASVSEMVELSRAARERMSEALDRIVNDGTPADEEFDIDDLIGGYGCQKP